MEPRDIPAIDTMGRPTYCLPPEAVRAGLDVYEFQVMGRTTFRGVLRRIGARPGEEWKAMAAMGKGSLEAMLQEMDEVGVEKVCIDQMTGWSWREHREWGHYPLETVADLVERSNGRLAAGAGYNPFRIRESLEEIDRAAREYGFSYVWAHPISFGLAPNDRRMYPLYTKCLELGLPCCFQSGHSAEPLPSQPGHPMHADEVALDFPDLVLVLTHTGWPWTGEWISMLWRHPNVYGNVGAYFPSDLPAELVRFMDTGAGRRKVLWGTNGFPLTRCKTEFMELPVQEETKRRVLRENAVEVFRI